MLPSTGSTTAVGRKTRCSLEAKQTFWHGMRDMWLLDEFVRSDDNHFEHHTYYAKDSQHWAPFYVAKCARDS